ncbi:MAG: hypothetical protein QG608_1151 [Actinomycetota bacterium]|nr:hypothetical protein [Actinomycetota bacterium]
MSGSSGAATVFLLVGLTGSGKTTYVRAVLEPAGVVRVSVDEEVFARNGAYGVDYPEHEYFARQAPVLDWATKRTASLVAEGRNVVLDHGLWQKTERQEWKARIEACGGRWRLLYFPVPREVLLERLRARNECDDANALTVTPEALDDFFARFDVPCGEGEEVVEAGSYPLA